MDRINHITIQVGNLCNFNCKYCFYDKTKTDKLIIFNRYKELLNLLRNIPLDDRVIINLSGGEPTLYKENIYNIYKYINKLNRDLNTNFVFGIYTNGTNLGLINELINNKILSTDLCNISWDGLNYDKVRINKNSRINVNDQLVKYKNTVVNNVLVRTAITSASIDCLYDSVKFLIDNNYKKWEYYFLLDNKDYNSESFLNNYMHQLELILNYTKHIKDFDFFNINNFKYLFNNPDKVVRIFCKQLGKSLYINCNGVVSPCGLCADDCIYFDNYSFSEDISNINSIIEKYNKYLDLSKNIDYSHCMNCKNIQCAECKFTAKFRTSDNKENQQCKIRDAEYLILKKYV